MATCPSGQGARQVSFVRSGLRQLPQTYDNYHSKNKNAMAQQSDDSLAVSPPAEPPDDSLFAAIRADDVQRLGEALSEGASVNSTAAVAAADGFPEFYPA